MSQAQGPLVEVHLVGVPVELWSRAAAHQEGVKREFEILSAQLDADAPPSRLHLLIEELRDRFGDRADAAREEREAAAARGERHVDVTYTLPPSVAAAARQLGDLLDEVDEFCRAGESLLSLATPPDLVEFRNWFLGEFVRQIEEGLRPRSWSDYREGVGDDESGQDRVVRFSGDLDLATAAALREELQARRAARAGDLTVDLTGVGFVDSVGISLMVTAHNTYEAEGQKVTYLMPARLRPLIELSGLIDVLDIDFRD